jgi:hypothetical protein
MSVGVYDQIMPKWSEKLEVCHESNTDIARRKDGHTQQRLCRSGMDWLERGASIILRRRALVLSQGRWLQFWDKIDQCGPSGGA